MSKTNVCLLVMQYSYCAWNYSILAYKNKVCDLENRPRLLETSWIRLVHCPYPTKIIKITRRGNYSALHEYLLQWIWEKLTIYSIQNLLKWMHVKYKGKEKLKNILQKYFCIHKPLLQLACLTTFTFIKVKWSTLCDEKYHLGDGNISTSFT